MSWYNELLEKMKIGLNTNYDQPVLPDTVNNGSSTGTPNVTSLLARQVMEEFKKDSLNEYSGIIGQALGNLFGSGQNDFKWQLLGENFAKDSGSSLAGTAVGFGSNLIGKGITSLGGNTPISRGFGSVVATGLGSIGGTIASNLIRHGNVAGNALSLFGTGGSGWSRFSTIGERSGIDGGKFQMGAINPYGLGMSIAGMGLQAALGPSREYNGRYGKVTRNLDTAYDALQAGVGFIPGYGQAAAGALALNKGLGNLFGSTDGMTVQDAILGSAFMPAPIKWINAGFGSSTSSFNNQSFQNNELTTNFMLNGFGNLQSYFDRASEEANKKYGLFSGGARHSAQANIDWSNLAYEQILDMAHLNRYLNIRSEDMASINNLKYAQMINGGWNPVARGKQGMKILNNHTNHNIGMRLLSAAALIDNKQMILSTQGGTKVNYKPDWSDKLEPYAAGLGLVGDAAGLTVASTGIGIPVGVSIAQAANIPSTVIDGYLTIRDGIRAYQNNGLGVDNALLNGTELLLDVTGLKILSNLNKAKKAGISAEKILSATEKNATSSYRRVGTGAGRALAKESAKRKAMYNAKRNKALQESIKVLNKRGIRRVLGDYFERKLADEMAKRGFGVSINDAIQSTNNTLRVNLGIANSVSAGVNIYDILDNKSK